MSFPCKRESIKLLFFLDFRLPPAFARMTGNNESTINQSFLNKESVIDVIHVSIMRHIIWRKISI